MTTQFGDVRFGGLGLVSLLGTGLSYLRPDADDLDGGWTTESGTTNLFPSIDESAPPNDSDFIKSSASPVSDICRVRLSNPNALVATPVKIRSRYKKSGSDPVNLIVRLKQGVTEKASWTYSGISNAFVTSEETLTVAQFNSITDFTDLFLEFEATTEDTSFWIVESDYYSSYLDPDAYLWHRSAGAVSDTRIGLVNDLIVGLKADGVWTKLDRLWLFAAENQGSALVDLKARTTATAVASPTFTADRGYQSTNILTQYINTNYNLSTQAVQANVDSMSISAWCVTNRAANAQPACGVFDGGSNAWQLYQFISVLPGSPGVGGFMGEGSGIEMGNSQSNGFATFQRTSSTTEEAYFNGVALTPASQTRTAAVFPNFNMFLLGRDNAGTFDSGNADQYAAFAFGAKLSATDAANFYNRIRTYMTAVGVP
jgi:hypothetical protein